MRVMLELSLYVLNCSYKGNIKNMSTVYIIPPYWHGTGSWNPSSCKIRTYLICIINVKGADVLATQGARTSVNIGSGNGLMVLLLGMSHYLSESQCWPRSMSRYDITRPQWIKLGLSGKCVQKCHWLLRTFFSICWWLNHVNARLQ